MKNIFLAILFSLSAQVTFAHHGEETPETQATLASAEETVEMETEEEEVETSTEEPETFEEVAVEPTDLDELDAEPFVHIYQCKSAVMYDEGDVKTYTLNMRYEVTNEMQTDIIAQFENGDVAEGTYATDVVVNVATSHNGIEKAVEYSFSAVSLLYTDDTVDVNLESVDVDGSIKSLSIGTTIDSPSPHSYVWINLNPSTPAAIFEKASCLWMPAG